MAPHGAERNLRAINVGRQNQTLSQKGHPPETGSPKLYLVTALCPAVDKDKSATLKAALELLQLSSWDFTAFWSFQVPFGHGE